MDVTATIDTHLAAYSEPNRSTRADLIANVWSNDGSVIDPRANGIGHEGIAGLAEALLDFFPEHRFERTTTVDAHHGFARYGWALRAPDGSTAVAGTDVAETDEHGRLVRIVGFFGDLQSTEVHA
jgi:hypothetical protein